MPRSRSDPSNHNTISLSASGLGARFSASEVRATAKLDTANPAKIKPSGLGSRIASSAKPVVANSAPLSAQTGSAQADICARPKYSANTAPKPALAVTPRMPGSASGLRNNPCNAAPLKPSDAPTIRPSSTRGKRISSTIKRKRSSPSISPLSTCHGDSGNGPSNSPAKDRPIISATKSASSRRLG